MNHSHSSNSACFATDFYPVRDANTNSLKDTKGFYDLFPSNPR